MSDIRRNTRWLSITLIATFTLLAVPAIAKAQTSERQTLVLGAGSSFAAPLYKAWIQAFTKDKPYLSMNYDSVGSGEGINLFVTGSVNFAGTDAPLTDVRNNASMICPPKT
jgi:phosphate transport system substrate-binding protein